MKIWAKISIKVVAFLLIFIVLFVNVQDILRYKWASAESIHEKTESYKAADEGIDVLYFGSSPMLAGVSPIVLWKEKGITGFNFGMSQQNALCIYYFLEQVLEYNTPRLVALDFHDITTSRKMEADPVYQSAYFKTMEISSFPRKIEILNEIKATNENPKLINYAFPILQYHTNWANLKKGDFVYQSGSWRYHEYQKGAYQKPEAVPVVPNEQYYDFDNLDENGNAKASDFALEYYRKIVELCRSKNIQVVALTLPNSDIPPESKYNLIQDFCDGYGMTYLNYNTYEAREMLGINYNEDLYDRGHLNLNGNIKVSKQLAKVFREKFGLEDHRDDAAYASWNSDWNEFYKDFEEILKKQGY